MKTLLSFFLLQIAFTGLNSQTPSLQWIKTYNSQGQTRISNSYLDAKGNLYEVGYFYSTMDADYDMANFSLTSAGNSDVFIAKYDKTGGLIWAHNLGSSQGDMGQQIHVAGNAVYVTGIFQGTVDFNPGADTAFATATSSSNFLLKLDTAGNFIWVKTFLASGLNSVKISALASDLTDNLYVLSKLSGTADVDPGTAVNNQTSAGGDDVGVIKLDAAGIFSWFRKVGGVESETPSAIAVDASGNVIFAGRHIATFDADPTSGVLNVVTQYTYSAQFIIKLDYSGNFLWAGNIRGANELAGIRTDDVDDIYITGTCGGATDFDPGADSVVFNSGTTAPFLAKWNAAGHYAWHKGLQPDGFTTNVIRGFFLDQGSNLYVTGGFGFGLDFDAGEDSLHIIGNDHLFVAKYDKLGNLVWAGSMQSLGVTNFYYAGIWVHTNGAIYIPGSWWVSEDVDISEDEYYLPASPNNTYDGYLLKMKERQVQCGTFNDINGNCNRDLNEVGVKGQILTINPGNYVALADRRGNFFFDSIPVGNYTAQINVIGPWAASCNQTISFSIIDPDSTIYLPAIALHTTQPCARPEVSIYTGRLRPCFSSNLISISAANSSAATAVIDSAYVILTLDSTINIYSSNSVYTSLGNYRYKILTGTLAPGQIKHTYLTYSLSCSVVNGETKCLQAEIFPVSACAIDTTVNIIYNVATCNGPWDSSSIAINALCIGDSVQFTVANFGKNMGCFMPLRVFVDGHLTQIDSFMLNSGGTLVKTFLGDSRTWRLETEQHPLYPGNSHPNASIEACGPPSTHTNWTSGLIGALPSDDDDAYKDISCGVATTAYDPNLKTGYPTGLTSNHYIDKNKFIDYVINFQNTGSDTAFDVFVRDTLTEDLDITSVVSGAASHNYAFSMYGKRVLMWSFRDILLPDSNTNEPASHGFVTFSVRQMPNLGNGTIIENSAGIYFDFNDPVVTNTAMHTVQTLQLPTAVIENTRNTNSYVHVYPNPADSRLFIETDKEVVEINTYNITGNMVSTSKQLRYIDVSQFSAGIYIAEIKTAEGSVRIKWVKM